MNAKDKDGIPVSIYALTVGNAQIVEKLMKAGVDVNFITKAGKTVLMSTSGKGDIWKIVRILIEARADVDAKSEDVSTA